MYSTRTCVTGQNADNLSLKRLSNFNLKFERRFKAEITSFTIFF